jgi:hypothetical protein
VLLDQVPPSPDGQTRQVTADSFSSGDQTRVASMQATLFSSGQVEVTALHSTLDCRNVDYIHTSLLLMDGQFAELVVLPTPARLRHQQGGKEDEDEEWRGGAMTKEQPWARMNKTAVVPWHVFQEVQWVKVFTRG